MSDSRVLWIDLCRDANPRGLVARLPPSYATQRIDRADGAIAAIHGFDPTVVCVEFCYPDAEHLRVIPAITRRFRSLPVVMFTEFHSEALSIWAFRSGVRDYRVKPIAAATLTRLLAYVIGSTNDRSQAHSAATMPAALVTPERHLFSHQKPRPARPQRYNTSPLTTRSQSRGRRRRPCAISAFPSSAVCSGVNTTRRSNASCWSSGLRRLASCCWHRA